MELSKRLQAVANLVSDGVSVVDVGTDHGYIPIYLLESQKSPKVLAMDVNLGPLKKAERHIREHGLQSHIETRQSDGVQNVVPGEFECVVIAGMGGALTVRILKNGDSVFRSVKEFILQPQSELWKVRKYLCEHKYRIIAEDMVVEDGKFYPMMKVINGQASAYNTVELQYGRKLLEQKHPVLKMFLEKELKVKTDILKNIVHRDGIHIEERRSMIEKELEEIKYALQRYYGND